jgi:hypothetical protein
MGMLNDSMIAGQLNIVCMTTKTKDICQCLLACEHKSPEFLPQCFQLSIDTPIPQLRVKHYFIVDYCRKNLIGRPGDECNDHNSYDRPSCQIIEKALVFHNCPPAK